MSKFITNLILLSAFSFSDAQTPPLRQSDLIGPADTLSISVLDSEELSKNWRVDASGRVNFPMIGTVDAAGKTTEALQIELTARLRKYYVEPQVMVYVGEHRSQPITIAGAVEHPGIYQLQEARSLAQVLLLASGPRDPGPTITVTRALASGELKYPGTHLDGSNQVLELQLVDVMTGHGPAAQLQIVANDIISVSTVKIPKLIQITGEVNRPGAIELVSHNSIPLIQALGMAGGMTRTASPKKTLIVRLDSEGNAHPQQVDVSKVLTGKIPGIQLHDGDVVVVGANNLMAFLQAASLSAVTTGVYMLGKF